MCPYSCLVVFRAYVARRTVNSLPCPMPGLVVVTLPPSFALGFVQQVVDELRHAADLPFDQGLRPLPRGRLARLAAQKTDGIMDRCQRAAELMAEHRQKLVLVTVGGGELFRPQPRLTQRPRVRGDIADNVVEDSGAPRGIGVVDGIAVDPRPGLGLGERQGLEDCAGLGIDDENAVLGDGQTRPARLRSEQRRAGAGFSGTADEQDRCGPTVEHRPESSAPGQRLLSFAPARKRPAYPLC